MTGIIAFLKANEKREKHLSNWTHMPRHLSIAGDGKHGGKTGEELKAGGK